MWVLKEMNPRPLAEQPGLLTSEPLLQPQEGFFWFAALELFVDQAGPKPTETYLTLPAECWN